MVVRYATEIHRFVIEPDVCPDCDEPFYETCCDAPGCNGRCCWTCGTGCDIEWASAEDGGWCATALAEEPEEEREARIDEERAAFGLSPALRTVEAREEYL